MIIFLAAIMAFTAIGIVSWPLLRKISVKSSPVLLENTEVSELLTQKDAALFALNELKSDYEIGSLSQSDYQELRKKYEEKAVAIIKTVDELRGELGLEVVSQVDEEIEVKVASLRAARNSNKIPVEARVSKLRRASMDKPDGKSCPGCGTTVVPGSLFCSRCGAALNMTCPGCSAPVTMEDVFCSRCGMALSNRGIAG